MGKVRRAEAARILAWCEENVNRMVGGYPNLRRVRKLPPGFYYEIEALPELNGGRFFSPISPTPIVWLRRGTPPPPKLPRYRVDYDKGNGWETVSDKQLIADGHNPTDYQPGPANPAPNLRPDYWLLWILGALVLLFLTIYIPAQK